MCVMDIMNVLHTGMNMSVASNIEQVLAATPHKAPTVRPPTTYHENYTS